MRDLAARFAGLPGAARDVLRGSAALAGWMLALATALQLGWFPAEPQVYVLIGVHTALAVALGRAAPIAGLGAVTLLGAWPSWYVDIPEAQVVPLLVAAYALGRSDTRIVVASPMVLVAAGIVLLPFLPPAGFSTGLYLDSLLALDPSLRAVLLALVVAALLLGRSAALQQRALEQVRARADELARLREADRLRIATEERTAIAREIHDVVAHHVTAMVVRAQASSRVATVTRNDEDAARELGATVEWVIESGREALEAMRGVVRILRTEPGGPAHEAIDARLVQTFPEAMEAIVQRVRDAGVIIETRIEPDLPFDGMQQFAVLRVTQEALSNVMLHSSGRRAAVYLHRRDDAIELTVVDDGEPRELFARPGTPIAATREGEGIRGMRERVESLGGGFSAGRPAHGGWRVEASLPLTEHSERPQGGSPRERPLTNVAMIEDVVT